MELDEGLIFGIYQLAKIESFHQGQPTQDQAKSGMFVFTRDHKLSVVSGSNDWVMAYTGTFEIKSDMLSIQVHSCVIRELEGQTITRKILALNAKNLILESVSSDGQKRTLLTWNKTQSL